MNTFFIIWVVVLTICIGLIIYDLCSVEKLLSNIHKRNKELSDYYLGLQGFTFTHIARLENPPKFKTGDKVMIESSEQEKPCTIMGWKYKELNDYIPTYTCMTDTHEFREVYEKHLTLYIEQQKDKPKTKKK